MFDKINTRILHIEKGEGRIAFLMFSFLFLIICSLLLVKPVRNSLFLSSYGIEKLPYVFIYVAIISASFTKLYSLKSSTRGIRRIINITLLLSSFMFILFWVLIRYSIATSFLYYALYVWVSIFGLLITTQFWLFANHIFSPRQAKRLFGFLGAGGIAGGIAGGYLANIVASFFGTNQLLLISAAILAITSILFLYISNITRYNTNNISYSRRNTEYNPNGPVKEIFKSRLLLLTSFVVALGVILANLIDYQYSFIASNLISDPDKLTAFFGFWLSTLSVISLFFQFFITPIILKNVGVGTSLLFLPVSIFLTSILAILFPGMATSITMKTSEGSLKQSINKSSRELLFLPIPDAVKSRVKPTIDITIDNIATGISGIALIMISNYSSVTFVTLSIVLISMLLVIITLRINIEYVNEYKKAISKRTINKDESTIANINSVIPFLDKIYSYPDKQIVYIMDLLGHSHLNILQEYTNIIFDKCSENVIKHYIKTITPHPTQKTIDILNDVYKNNDNLEYDNIIVACVVQYKLNTDKFSESYYNSLPTEYKPTCILQLMHNYYKNSDYIRTIAQYWLDGIINDTIQEINNSKDINTIYTIAYAAALSKNEKSYNFLNLLLISDKDDIVKIGIRMAGNTKHNKFIKPLIRGLSNRSYKHDASTALSNYGEISVPYMKALASDSTKEWGTRIAAIRVLARIPIQKSIDSLYSLLNVTDITLQKRTLHALLRMKSINRFLLYKNRILDDYIAKLCDTYSFIARHKANENDLLLNAINSTKDDVIELLLLCMQLYYNEDTIRNISWNSIASGKLQAEYFIEIADNTLSKKHKRNIIPILDEHMLKKKCTNGEYYDIGELLSINSRWLRAVVLYTMSVNPSPDQLQISSLFTDDPDIMISESAKKVIENYHKKTSR